MEDLIQYLNSVYPLSEGLLEYLYKRSGEHWGWFYLFYVLLALPHGGIHAILALVGVSLLVFSYIKYKRAKKYIMGRVLNLEGLVCLLLSLYFFFSKYPTGYNNETFEQFVPIISVVIFTLLAISFIIDNLVHGPGMKSINGNSFRGHYL